jgi:hypothetical protein
MTDSSNGTPEAPKPAATEKVTPRKIPGGLPYTTSAGVLKRVLDNIPTSEKPTVFNSDFLGTVMRTTGGAARPVIPFLKATGLLNQAGTPTELYSQYQTEAGRPFAAIQALRNGYAEIFRRNQYAHRADDNALSDIIVAITGLPGKDPIVRNILNTFKILQSVAKTAREDQITQDAQEPRIVAEIPQPGPAGDGHGRLNLAYNINVILPETTNVEVYNAIFRSLKGNLLN